MQPITKTTCCSHELRSLCNKISVFNECVSSASDNYYSKNFPYLVYVQGKLYNHVHLIVMSFLKSEYGWRVMIIIMCVCMCYHLISEGTSFHYPEEFSVDGIRFMKTQN